MACVVQPIKVQTAPGKIEAAILHVIESGTEASNADKRFKAMVRQTPLHAFMFSQHGKLLVANDAAMEACLHSAAGLKVSDPQNITLKSLFDLGAYEGNLVDLLPSVSLVPFGRFSLGDHESDVLDLEIVRVLFLDACRAS